MNGEPAAFSRTIFAAVLFTAGLGIANPAAAGPESLRDSLFGRRPSEGRPLTAPPVARYVSEGGDVFVLDRTQSRPLLKFDNDPEVWALRSQPAPRGDVIYKNDLGEPVLRATRLGGVTLFTDQRPGGSAAALSGGGVPLRLSPLGPQALLERLAQASARASRAARRLIPFDADASPASSALIADAATVTSEAVVRMTRRNDGGNLLARLRQVRLVEGRKSSAQLNQGTLQITVAPSEGLAGRPSSERIVAVAAAAR
ncbi:DUF4908 domain-containing protein [Phenylobacterium hankyongense]|uniref:DUF4908 domain-containing protein n=1 Tax=Phenylobacterium hankyongense TaxID=1813876 RepID=A0A328B5U8_9CAUL|nr:DUF4908 domain-containing protein [Phenylobacterium hankyongense]